MKHDLHEMILKGMDRGALHEGVTKVSFPMKETSKT